MSKSFVDNSYVTHESEQDTFPLKYDPFIYVYISNI